MAIPPAFATTPILGTRRYHVQQVALRDAKQKWKIKKEYLVSVSPNGCHRPHRGNVLLTLPDLCQNPAPLGRRKQEIIHLRNELSLPFFIQIGELK